MVDYSLYLISNRPQIHKEIQYNLGNEKLNFFDGTGIRNFSTLVNSCVEFCPTETIILMSDKVRPTASHVYQTLDLLSKDYAFVGLYLFRFFAFKKELLRRIGFFDERFVGTGYEDYDFIVRLLEHNLSFYTQESVPYIPSQSQWTVDGHYPGYSHWCVKWRHTWEPSSNLPVSIQRTVAEERYTYNLGPSISAEFITGRENCVWTNYPHVGAFFDMQILSDAKLRHENLPIDRIQHT